MKPNANKISIGSSQHVMQNIYVSLNCIIHLSQITTVHIIYLYTLLTRKVDIALVL